MPVRLPLLLLFVAAVAPAAAQPATVDYLRDVKPLLTQHCVRCHGGDKQEAGLRLDTAVLLDQGGDSGPVVLAGRSARSLLLQVIAGTHPDIPRMPYKKPPLDDAAIAVVAKWIDEGAPAPDDEEPGRFVHWAFVPPGRPTPPAVRRTDWPRNPIDHFILARLEQDNIAPSPEADRVTLLRRLHLDLVGLPPTPGEVRSFLADLSADAYERAVERLLASAHHGERWGRVWLDVARYADSNGYSIDAPRQIWKYRDWVVDAFNRDLPFDRFVIEQLAGDLLPDATVGQKVATGFNRNTQINQEGGIDPEQFRIESVLDRVDTFGTAFLGLTVSCAQCHDHKFDPITQREYYQLFAFFNNTVDDGHGKSTPGGLLEFPEDTEPNEGFQRELEEARTELEEFLNARGGEVLAWQTALTGEDRAKLRANVRAALEIPWDQQTFAQRRAVFGAFNPRDPEYLSHNGRLTRIERRQPRAVSTLVMSELPEPRASHVFIKGDFTRHGERVSPGTPAILPPLPVGAALRRDQPAAGDVASELSAHLAALAESRHDAEESRHKAAPAVDPSRREAAPTVPNRLDLARWVVDPGHPLTARVMVNRVWQQYFGRGIVETENDFGTQGIPPTHPDLLDWLATEFVAKDWSLKALHRRIVTSATYRQSSRARSDLALVDPTNKLLARQPRLRLDAEIVRDVALAASGLLVPKIGGPPVFPPQPDGVMTLGQVRREWRPGTGEDRYRRGLYTHLWRATPHPALAVFDAADGFSACTRRIRSNTPLQALTLLNDQQFHELAVALADRIQNDVTEDLAAQLEFAFQLCLARAPAPVEHRRLQALFEGQYAATAGDPAAKRRVAWTAVARVLLNLDETITRE
jgi:mono/diheme cytochrome c family protein